LKMDVNKYVYRSTQTKFEK